MVLPIFETLVDSFKKCKEKIPEMARYIDSAIEKIEEYMKQTRKTRIYALAMSTSSPRFSVCCLSQSVSFKSDDEVCTMDGTRERKRHGSSPIMDHRAGQSLSFPLSMSFGNTMLQF